MTKLSTSVEVRKLTGKPIFSQLGRTNDERNMNERKKNNISFTNEKSVHEGKLQILLLSFEHCCLPFVRSCSIISLNVRSFYEHFPVKKSYFNKDISYLMSYSMEIKSGQLNFF